MQVEEKYMLRCLELAQSGRALVAPNPMVGAVIVHKGQIIGEGFHLQYGGSHAEVNAIQAVRDETMLRDSTLYVNLEPCTHHGQTPPCTELIIRKKIPRVVIGCLDPFPEVAGMGIKRLRDAGVEVVTDVMREDAMFLNRYFITSYTKHRPYVILKWAQSKDGYIDRIREDVTEKPVQLSNAASRRYVHRLRSEVASIMVGTNTAWLDNPALTVRHWVGKSPVRVLLDRTLRIPLSYRLFDGAAPTIVFTENDVVERLSHQIKAESLPINSVGYRPMESCVLPSTAQKGRNPYFALSGLQLLVNPIDRALPYPDDSALSGLVSIDPLPPQKGNFCEGGKNVEYIPIDFTKEVISQVLQTLHKRKIYSLLVEGGASLHTSFLDSGLWDELQIETTSAELGFGVKCPINNPIEIADFHKNICFSEETFQKENQTIVCVYFYKKKV